MRQFHRYVEVLSGEVKLNSEQLTIQFDVPFDSDTEPNESEVIIYNLTDDTINRLKFRQKLIINAGYIGAIGEVLVGRISNVKTKYEGADKKTTIHILDSSDVGHIEVEEKTYRSNVKASQIINDLAPKFNIPTVIRLPKNVTYAKGFTADGEVQEVLSEIAKDCGARSYINRGSLYIQALENIEGEKVLITPENGLVGSPDSFEEEGVHGHRVKFLLRHSITTGSQIEIQSRKVSGTFRVRNGSHRCSDSSFYTEVEVV